MELNYAKKGISATLVSQALPHLNGIAKEAGGIGNLKTVAYNERNNNIYYNNTLHI